MDERNRVHDTPSNMGDKKKPSPRAGAKPPTKPDQRGENMRRGGKNKPESKTTGSKIPPKTTPKEPVNEAPATTVRDPSVRVKTPDLKDKKPGTQKPEAKTPSTRKRPTPGLQDKPAQDRSPNATTPSPQDPSRERPTPGLQDRPGEDRAPNAQTPSPGKETPTENPSDDNVIPKKKLPSETDGETPDASESESTDRDRNRPPPPEMPDENQDRIEDDAPSERAPRGSGSGCGDCCCGCGPKCGIRCMGGGLIGGLAGGLIGGATGVLLAYPQLDELGLKTEDERQEYVTSSGLAFGIVGAVIGGIIGGTIGSFSDTAPPGPAASPSALWAYQSQGSEGWE